MRNGLLLFLLLIVGCSSQPEYGGEFEVRLHQLHIEKHGPIEINWMLDDAAEKHAIWMSKYGLSHTGENGSSVANRVEYTGWTTIGENIAYGQSSPDEVMKSWMSSSGHRKNIQNQNFTYMGIGTAFDSSNRIYWCVVFSN